MRQDAFFTQGGAKRARAETSMRAGSYEKFTRLVFDWPKDVSYQVFPGAGKMTVKFDTPIRMDVSAVARFAPAWVKNVAWRVEGNSTIVEMQTDTDSGYHDFRDGARVVLDVLAPKTDADAYTDRKSTRLNSSHRP